MLLSLALLASMSSVELNQCRAFGVTPSRQQLIAEAALVTRTTGKNTGTRAIARTMSGQGWLLIWAQPDNSEAGVLVFRGGVANARHVDDWGGTPDARSDARIWAQKLGMPDALARCFGDYVWFNVP